MVEKTDIEKLQILLAHWVDHNHSHAAEMEKWQKVAADHNKPEVATLIDTAIKGISETDKALTSALEKLGGVPAEHHHHHHH